MGNEIKEARKWSFFVKLSEAIAALEQGKKIRAKDWPDVTYYLYLDCDY